MISFKHHRIPEGYVAVDMRMSDDETCDILIEEGSNLVADGWDIKTKAHAIGLKIVRCSYNGCTKPATHIDGHYPYYCDYNRCDEHNECEVKE